MGLGYQRLDSRSGIIDFNPIQIRAFGSDANDLDGILTFNYKVLPQLLVTSPLFEGNFACVNGVRLPNLRDRDGMLVLDVALRPVVWPGTGWEFNGGYSQGSGLGASHNPTLFSGPDQNSWRSLYGDPRWMWSADGQNGITQISQNGIGPFYEDRAAFHYTAHDLLPNALRADRDTTFSVKLTDGADPNAPELEAKYKVRWRFPLEAPVSTRPDLNPLVEGDSEVLGTEPYARLGGDFSPNATGTIVTCRVYRKSPYARLFDPLATLLGWGSELTNNPLWGTLLASCSSLARVAYDNSYQDFGITFMHMWSHPQSEFSPPKDESRINYYLAVPVYMQGRTLQFRRGEKFGSNGFEKLENYVVEFFDGREVFYGRLTDPWAPPSGGSGGGSGGASGGGSGGASGGGSGG